MPSEPPEKPNEPERAAKPYPIKAYIYNYADSNWKDKLTSIETYNVNSSGHMVQGTVVNLTYDSMGNPTNYLGFDLAWEGKQLQSCGLTVGTISIACAYSYNEDGLRTQKIGSLNGSTGEATNYYYNGSVLIGMQKGSVVQRFSYDAQGKVVAVDYSTNGGSTYTTYYYLRNAQGDIVKLIDNNKNTVVEYTYDSWGKLISTTGSLATSLGANQPFRYRGYVYDTETGWYYLQSRYYNPEVCRFISSDVYLSTGQGVIGHNSYAYCLNNPVNGHDSDGQAFRPYNVGMTDGGGGGILKRRLRFYTKPDNQDTSSAEKIYGMLKDSKGSSIFDDKSWGEIHSICIEQKEDTEVKFSTHISIALTSGGMLAPLFIPKAGPYISTVLSVLSIIDALSSLPNGTYSTYAVTVTGTITMNCCGVISEGYYTYETTVFYLASMNKHRISLPTGMPW